MKKDSLKKNQKLHTNDEVKNYLGSLKEHFDDKFKVVEEGFQSMNQRLYRIEDRLGKVENKLDTKVDRYEFVALEKRVGVVEKK